MELRDPGCRFCQRSTAGDCGRHGSQLLEQTEKILGPVLDKMTEEVVEELTPPLFPKMQSTLVEAETRLAHFVCSVNADHVIFVRYGGPGLPPAPTICPWKCGWMDLKRVVHARGLEQP
jgi:hypothetical protein